MKIILKLIAIIIIIAMAILASFNKTVIDLKVWNEITYHIQVAHLIMGVLMAGVAAEFAWIWSFYAVAQEKLKEYKRQLEKKSVNVECESSKVDVLEAKIQVLEKALKSALEKNNE